MIPINKIDLHMHTTGSDGKHTPQELLDLCKQHGLDTVAVSDHDTMSNVEIAVEYGAKIGINVIPAVELSAKYTGELHILGYGIDVHNREISDFLENIRNNRNKRNPRIVANLQNMGYNITMDEVKNLAKGQVCGRVHIAQMMVNKGYVESTQEVFNKYIAFGKPAYVARVLPSLSECISVIISAGGDPVIAHPKLTELEYPTLFSLIKDMKKQGLVGIEVYHSSHSPENIKEYLGIAKALDLIITCGSDYHGLKDGPMVGNSCPDTMPERTVSWIKQMLN